MPKYYRFRATMFEDNDKGRDFFRNEKLHDMDLTPAQLWYLRRTAWREGPLEPPAHTAGAVAAKSLKSLSAAAVARLTADAAAGQPIFVVKLRTKKGTQYL